MKTLMLTLVLILGNLAHADVKSDYLAGCKTAFMRVRQTPSTHPIGEKEMARMANEMCGAAVKARNEMKFGWDFEDTPVADGCSMGVLIIFDGTGKSVDKATQKYCAPELAAEKQKVAGN